MTLSSAFPTEYVDRTDANYKKVPWHHFALKPGKDGSNLQDFIRSTEDLQSALGIKSIRDSVPHYSGEGRELTIELLREVVTSIISQSDTEWVAVCDGFPTNLICHAVTAGAASPVSRLCTGRIRA